MPLVSIIIINYKTPIILLDCLQSILEYEAYPNYEIILLDNDSQDESIELVRTKYPAVQIITSTVNLGFAKGNNQAVKTAKGDYLLFINSDTKLTCSIIESFIKASEANNHISILGPRIRNSDGTIQPSVFRFPTLWRAFCESFFLATLFPRSKLFGDYRTFTYTQLTAVDYVSGACFFISKRTFDKVSGFDESFFMYAEEADLMFRLHKRGYQTYFLPYGDITHLGGASDQDKSMFKQSFFESQTYFYQKHYGSLGLRIFLISKVAGYLLRNLALLIFRKHEIIHFNTQIIKFYARKLF